MTAEPPLCALAFGARWHSEFALPLFHAPRAEPETEPLEALPPDAEQLTIRSIAEPSARTLYPAEHGRRVVQAADGFRYTDSSGTVLDAYHDGQIEVAFAAAHYGTLPAGFFGTVSGLMLALRGKVPLHGSAVEIDGEAVLLCGASGAGKSTAAAALIARGARLISDDLTVMHLHTGTPQVYAGRRTMRLFLEVAQSLRRHASWLAEPFLAAGKLAVFPPCVSPVRALRLRTVVLLGREQTRSAPHDALAAQLYRPAWMRSLPHQAQRRAILAIAAGQLQIRYADTVEARTEHALLEHGQRLSDLLNG